MPNRFLPPRMRRDALDRQINFDEALGIVHLTTDDTDEHGLQEAEGGIGRFGNFIGRLSDDSEKSSDACIYPLMDSCETLMEK